ncbi:MAG: phage holin family protein [Verrucomicrobiota bacterium]
MRKVFLRAIMQAEPKKILKFLQSWVINTAAVFVAVLTVPGIRFRDNSIIEPLITAFVLGILNAFVRPILIFFALPLLIFTLGLFMLVINALLLCLVSWLMHGYFQVDSFGSAFLGAIVISIVSIGLNILTGNMRAGIKIRRRPTPPPKKSDDDDGPVIDV